MQTAILIRKRLGMHERQIEKLSQCLFGCFIKAACNRSIGYIACKWIGCKRKNTAAEHVTGELVEENHKGERAFRVRFPCAEFATRCLLMYPQKFCRDDLIKMFVFFKPTLRTCFAPERYDL